MEDSHNVSQDLLSNLVFVERDLLSLLGVSPAIETAQVNKILYAYEIINM